MTRERASHSTATTTSTRRRYRGQSQGTEGTWGQGCASVKRDRVPVPQDECVEAGGGEGHARVRARGVPPNHMRRHG